MKKSTALAALTSALLVTGCATTEPVSSGLAGSTWAGPDHDGGTLHCEFFPNGQMSLSASPGTWHQEGSTVTLTANNGYAIYSGTISGNTMGGTAKNSAGKTWTWRVTRLE